MCTLRQLTGLAAAAAALTALTKPASAQVPAATPTPIAHGPLTVRTTSVQGSTTYMIHGAQVCLGTASKPTAYGGPQATNTAGTAHFASVPIGVPIYITVMAKPAPWGVGFLQGKRVNYVAKAPGLLAEVPLVIGTGNSPLCLNPSLLPPLGDAVSPAAGDTPTRESAR